VVCGHIGSSGLGMFGRRSRGVKWPRNHSGHSLHMLGNPDVVVRGHIPLLICFLCGNDALFTIIIVMSMKMFSKNGCYSLDTNYKRLFSDSCTQKEKLSNCLEGHCLGQGGNINQLGPIFMSFLV